MLSFMTKLDAVLERIRQLPQDRQDALAVDMELWLEEESEGSLLTDEQWAEIEAALAEVNEETVTHDEVMARARAKLAE